MLLESACMPITSSKSRSSQYYIVASSRRRHDYMGINYNGLITKKLAWREKCMKNGTKIDDNHFCGPHDDHWSLSYRPIRIKLSIYGAFDHIYHIRPLWMTFSGIGARNRMLVLCVRWMRANQCVCGVLWWIILSWYVSLCFHNGLAIWLISFHVNALVISAILHAQFSTNFLPLLLFRSLSRHDNIL